MGVAELSEEIDALAALDPSALADRESMVDLHRELSRLDAVLTRAAAAFEAGREFEADGAQTAAAWLATTCGLPRQLARRRVRLGRGLRHLPVCEQAWLAGEITAEHVGAIAALRRPATEAALARDEAMLVEDAIELRFESFTRVLAYWGQRADPDGAEDDEEGRRARRDVYLERSFAGMWLGRMTLDPISGAVVGGELARIERAMFETDWAEARHRLGHEPSLADLGRTPGQRRADALVEMATRSRAVAPGTRAPAPLFTVLVGYETLRGRICELADGTVLAPGALVPWLSEAMIQRAVFDPPNRVEVSRTSRLFTGATRRALEILSPECEHAFCDRPAEDCQADHVVPWGDGGPTTQENGQSLCGFHNRLKQRRGPP
jgi:hypothetical protein